MVVLAARLYTLILKQHSALPGMYADISVNSSTFMSIFVLFNVALIFIYIFSTSSAIYYPLLSCLTLISLGYYNIFTIFWYYNNSIPLYRLLEMARHRYPRVYDTEEEMSILGKRVLVYHESTCASLMQRWDVDSIVSLDAYL